jgi:hypothetical protein
MMQVAFLLAALVAVGFAAEPIQADEPTTRPATRPAETLKVELVTDDRTGLHIRFTNLSDEPFVILKPLDGSWWGWYRPHYKVHMVDEQGQQVPLGSRCGVSGLWHETVWPADYAVTLGPDAAHMQRWDGPSFDLKPGKYRYWFEYRVEEGPSHLGVGEDVPPDYVDPFPLPAGTWTGVAATDPVEFIHTEDQ